MKSAFCRVSAIAVKLLAGSALLASMLVLSVIALSPEILCVASVIHGTRALRIFSVLALLVALTPFIGCSSKSPEPATPAAIRWHGPATGYEDTTKPADQPSLK